jgi:small-conductance mechanosensitive channel
MNVRSATKSMSICISRRLSFVLAFLLALGISFAVGQPSSAQFSLPTGLGPRNTADLPAGVTRYGNIEAITVNSPLSNRTLFTIASPTVYDRSAGPGGDRVPVEQRAATIRDKLLLLIERPMDPETLVFEVSTFRDFTVIDVRDAKFTEPLILATVTEEDANYAGVTIDELATVWRDTLETDLRDGLVTLPDTGQQVSTIVVFLVVLSAVIFGLKFVISRRQKQYRLRKKEINAEAENAAVAEEFQTEASPESIHRQVEQKRASLLQELQQTFNLDRRLSALDFIQWLLFWLVILAWYAGGAWVAWQYPYIFLNSPIGQPLRIVLDLLTVWFFTGLAIRICRRLIDYFATEREGLDLTDLMAFGDSERRHLRASTVAGAAKGLVTIVLVLFGILLGLQYLEVPTASLVAITSVAGLAITFGSQNLVKDLVNGFFILAEDQYAVGDVIDIGNSSGLVESLNLRVTQLRSGNGDLVTIPNSSITQVKNSTRNWSRVSCNINVAYETDPDIAIEVLKEVAQTFYHDPEWQDTMLAEPTVLGLDSVSKNGISITILIQTAPAQQWAVGRELRLRIRRTLVEHGIAIGAP